MARIYIGGGGIGAGLDKGLSDFITGTNQVLNRMDTEEYRDKQMGFQQAQEGRATAQEARNVEQYNRAMKRERVLDRKGPLKNVIEKISPIPEAGEYIGQVARDFGYADEEGNISMRNLRDLAGVVATNPTHVKALSKIRIDSAQKTLDDIDKQIAAGTTATASAENLKPLFMQKIKAQETLDVAKAQDGEYQKYLEGETKKKETLLKEKELGLKEQEISRKAAEISNVYELAMKASGGDPKRAMAYVVEQTKAGRAPREVPAMMQAYYTHVSQAKAAGQNPKTIDEWINGDKETQRYLAAVKTVMSDPTSMGMTEDQIAAKARGIMAGMPGAGPTPDEKFKTLRADPRNKAYTDQQLKDYITTGKQPEEVKSPEATPRLGGAESKPKQPESSSKKPSTMELASRVAELEGDYETAKRVKHQNMEKIKAQLDEAKALLEEAQKGFKTEQETRKKAKLSEARSWTPRLGGSPLAMAEQARIRRLDRY